MGLRFQWGWHLRTFSLARPRTCLVEPIRPSGLTRAGIYVLDHDNVKDMNHDPFSLIVRVTKVNNKCVDVEAGKVYGVKDMYNRSILDIDGVRHFLMHEDNMVCEFEGYDDQVALLQQEHDDQPERYGVCAK